MNAMSHAPPAQSPRAQMGRSFEMIGINIGITIGLAKTAGAGGIAS